MNLRARIKDSLAISKRESQRNDGNADELRTATSIDEGAGGDETQGQMRAMTSDSWALKELAEHIKGSGEDEHRPEEKFTGYRAVIVGSLDRALEIVGRSGRDVIYGLMERRYGLRAADIFDKPGVYVSALRDILGTSCIVVEKHALAEIRDAEGVEAHTIEEAVFKLKKKYGEA